MKSWFPFNLGLLVGVGLLAQLTGVRAQSSTRKVLDLDGKGGYVELPGNLFTNDVVTVEGWMKWRAFGSNSRFFEFDDAALQIGVFNRNVSSDLTLQRFRPPAFDDLTLSGVANMLKAGTWFHLAVVSGTNWSRVYVNGALVSTNEVPFRWKPNPLPPPRNFLGRSVMKDIPMANPDADLDGQMTEVRLWAGARSEEEIRTNLFAQRTGREPGLLALWNFADGTANDSTTNARHGELMGQAKVVEATLPSAATLVPWSRLLMRVTDLAEMPLANVSIRAVVDGLEVGSATSRAQPVTG